MITLSRARQLIDSGLSLITIGDEKIPNYAWKKYQTESITKDVFEIHFQNPTTKGIGIVTGYNNLEVIDIDLKILPSLREQQDFWNEYISFLKDNIDEFDKKFVVFKTINNGYHILYRCAKITTNTKIAKLKGHKEAIIETRGIGGYVFVYENKASELDYTDIKEISELDRECLWEISKTYDFKEELVKEETKEFAESKKTPWQDYNEQVGIFDIISTDFDIVRTLADKYIIRRLGAQSAHSGYVYKNSGCMYLFSTGTIYPNEKLISPFSAYTFKNFNGNFSAAAKDIYAKGYGSRVVKEPKSLREKPIIKKEDLEFPIDIFPVQLQNYILECNRTLNSSVDYMGCSFLWLASVIIGNSFKMKVKNGWIEPCVIWIALVGKAGLGKTPSINNIIRPLMQANNSEIKKFIKNNEKYHVYKDLDKKDKMLSEEIKKPIKTQFIANDITLEALVDLHEENDNAVGVFKDELAGWFKDMNKYRAGSDLEFWLSSWSGQGISLNRKTAKSAFVEKPIIPVLGGIQPSIFNLFYTEENKDNGFLDRMLLSYPALEIDMYNDNEMDNNIIEWYSATIKHFYDSIKVSVIKRDVDGNIIPCICEFDTQAKKEWIRIFNELSNTQNSHDENEYMKSMLPKQKIYIPRFAMLINIVQSFFDNSANFDIINKKSILNAERLSKYFIAMAKKIKIDSVERADIKTIINETKGKTNKEKFAIMLKENPDLNVTDISELLNVSRKTIYEWKKTLDNTK